MDNSTEMLLIDGIKELKTKVDNIENKKVNDIEIKIGNITNKIASNDAYIKSYKEGLEKLEIRFEKLDESTDKIYDNINTIENRVINLEHSNQTLNNKMDQLNDNFNLELVNIKDQISNGNIKLRQEIVNEIRKSKLEDDRQEELDSAQRKLNSYKIVFYLIGALIAIIAHIIVINIDPSLKSNKIVQGITLIMPFILKPLLEGLTKRIFK